MQEERQTPNLFRVWRFFFYLIGFASMTLQFIRASIILNSPSYRERIVDDVKYWIVPGVILSAEAVMNDWYVPADEMRDFYFTWNGAVVTIEHPNQWDGANVPFPDVPVVGKIFNAIWEEDKQRVKVEFWLDVKKLERTQLGRDTKANVKAGNALNVSTGYWAEFELAEGEINGKKYNVIHRNLRPDHVAILPATEGACSLADGCGLGVNKRLTVNCSKCPKNKEAQNMTVRKYTLRQLQELLPGVFGEADEENLNMEVEFDPTALLNEDELEKLTAKNEGDKSPPKSKVKPQTPAQPGTEIQLPQEIVDFAQVLKDAGGADAFASLLSNVQRQNDQTKGELVKQIMSVQNTYTKDDLEAMEIDDLQRLSQLLMNSMNTVNFMGIGNATVQNNEGQNNSPYVPIPSTMLALGKKEE